MLWFVTHNGSCLNATIVGRSMFMTGITTIVEDENGDQMAVSLYNRTSPEITSTTSPDGRTQNC